MTFSAMPQRRQSLEHHYTNTSNGLGGAPTTKTTPLRSASSSHAALSLAPRSYHRPPSQVLVQGGSSATPAVAPGMSARPFSRGSSFGTAATTTRDGPYKLSSSDHLRLPEDALLPQLKATSTADYSSATLEPLSSPAPLYNIRSEKREPHHRRIPTNGSHTSSSQSSSSINHNTTATNLLADHSQLMRKLLDDLSRAQGREYRLSCLSRICDACHHDDEALHNLELSLSVVPTLTKCLATSTQDDEMGKICAALELVLRASPRNVQLAYMSKASGIIPNSNNHALLQHSLVVNWLKILIRCELGVVAHPETVICTITKSLCHFAACADLRASLLRQEGMLDMLCRVAPTDGKAPPMQQLKKQTHNYTQPPPLSLDCRLLRLQLMTTLASCEANKVLLFEKEGLVDGLVRCAHFDSSDLIRQYSGTTLMELASAPANQVPMAKDDHVLGVLVKMVLVERGSIVRESVITALQNLAFAKENRVRLVAFKDGVLVEALKQALSSDADHKTRRRAAGALTNLVCHETASKMGMHNGLLNTLAIVSTKDVNADVQTRASLALTKIANCITARMGCHEALLDALVVASLSKAFNSISAVLRVKARDAANREVMARHRGVVDTLCDLCLSEGSTFSDKDNATRALMHLCNEPKNRQVLCTKTVLEALVAGANYIDPDLEEARDSAIRSLERLGTEPSNRGFMARHGGLLTAVAQAVEREADWEESCRESEHGYLAKPLLMSLLVSM